MLHSKQRAVDAAAKKRKQQEQALKEAHAVLAAAYQDVKVAEGRLQAATEEEKALQDDFKKYSIQCGSKGDELGAVFGEMLGGISINKAVTEDPDLKTQYDGLLDIAKKFVKQVEEATKAKDEAEAANKAAKAKQDAEAAKAKQDAEANAK